jgi:hypothetical protein
LKKWISLGVGVVVMVVPVVPVVPVVLVVLAAVVAALVAAEEVVPVAVAAMGGDDGWVFTDCPFMLLAVDAREDEDGKVAIDDESEEKVEGAGIKLAFPSSMNVRKVR